MVDIMEDERKLDDHESGGGGEGVEEREEVSGWADSIAKILKTNKPKGKKELMLAKARKDYEVSESRRREAGVQGKPQREIEVVPLPVKKVKVKKQDDDGGDIKEDVGEGGEGAPVKEEQKEKEDILSLKSQRKMELKQKKLELAWENLARMSAEKTAPQLEKDLVKVATKGVVQLFNAISMQQKTIKSKLKKANKSEFKKDKVLNKTKEIFDDAMDKSKKMEGKNGEVTVKEEEVSSDEEEDDVPRNKRKGSSSSSSNASKKPKWNALQDDFMLDAKLKDWDKESDSASDSESD